MLDMEFQRSFLASIECNSLQMLRKIKIKYYICIGARGSVVVKALFYKPEGRGFDTR
jgi:hypothetical protein